MRTGPYPRLASAVLLAGGLLTGVAASPALAEPVDVTDPERPWSAEHGVTGGYFTLRSGPELNWVYFTTEYEVPAEDVRVTVAPYSEEEGRGEELPVAFTYDEELEHGDLDVVATRRALGVAGTGQVIYTLYIQEDDVATLTYGPDADLDDDVPSDPIDAQQRLETPFEILPTAWGTTLLAAPEQRHVFVAAWNRDPDVRFEIAEGPAEGRVVAVDEEVTGGPTGYVYQAPEGFVGADTLTLRVIKGDTVKTHEVTIRFGDPRVEHFDWRNERISGYVTFPVEGLFDDAEPTPSEPAEPSVPAEPTPSEPAEPSAPAEPTDPGEGEHTVPDTVETGGATAWWLAAVAALTAGVLVRVRGVLHRA